MTASKLISSFTCLSLLVWSTPIQASDLTPKYSWKQMKIGGGGWMVGMDIHPTEKGLMYARTDVSGAYRWQPESSSWKQIVTSDSMPAAFVGYGRYRGVDSLVGAPKDPDIAYMAYEGEIFRSTNRGDKWAGTGFAKNNVQMEANGDGRQDGERLGVDPNNSNVVYYCSNHNGLWVTNDAGAQWKKIERIPAGSPPHGVNTVVFDKSSGTVGTGKDAKTKVIYVTTYKSGTFRSDDAGATWTNIADGGPKTSSNIRDAEIAPDDGTYYVVSDNENDAVGSIWQYTPGGKWQDITPKGEQGGNQPYWDIAIDPTNAKHLMAIRSGGQCFISTDKGSTWNHHSFQLKSPNIQWLGKQENYWLSVGEIAFDPAGKLWFAEGFGMWWTDNFTTENIEWQAASEGIEETCGNDIIAPPGGKPLGAMWDVGVFRFEDPDSYTALRATPYFMSAWALDWCAADPKFIVAVFRSHLGFPPHINENGYSTDGGLTWTIFPAFAKKEIPADLGYGIIAVSANSTDKIVWVPADQKLPRYTADRGVTWKESSLEGTDSTGFHSFPGPQKSLCADRVLPDTFYFYHPDQGIFVSKDSGATFSKIGTPLPMQRFNSIMKAIPGHAGDLWFAEGSQGTPVGGIWRSKDGGATWTQAPFIEQAFNFGIGKALKDGGYPTLYVAGIANGETGIYRSTDEGSTWDKIGGYPLGIFDWIDAMDADKDVFGKVYINFTSAGLAYGAENSK